MKKLNVIKYIFAIAGAGMLIIAFFIYKSNNKFLETAIISQGTVVELVQFHSTSDHSISYRPLVKFIDKNGKNIEFPSSSSSNPPSYNVGEKVQVLYNPKSPNDAKINSFFSIWGGTFIIGTMGIVFFLLGLSAFIFDKKKSDMLKLLKQNGTTIETDFQNIIINNSSSKNGRKPYQIVSQWQNPSTSKLHVFNSEDIWFDPTNYMKTEKIKVLIDKNNLKNYLTDLSFLPGIE